MKLGTGSYFWATYRVPSGNDKIYLADSVTGRGIFSFDGPSDICGLTYGAGYLWAINRVGNSNAHIYKIKVHINSPGDNCYTTPIEGECSCRHLIGTARSEANGIITSSIQDKHIFAIPPTTSGFSNQWIPHEWGVLDSNYQMNDAIVYEGSYKPAGDSSSTQYYYEISLSLIHI